MSSTPNPAVEDAARWLAGVPIGNRPRPIVPELARRFGLTPCEACHAIREATLQHARAM